MSETPLSGMPVNYREAITAFQHGDGLDFHTSNLRPYEDVAAERMAAELAAASNTNPMVEILSEHDRARQKTKDVVNWRRELVDGTIALSEESTMFSDRQKDYGLAA